MLEEYSELKTFTGYDNAVNQLVKTVQLLL